MADLIFTDHGSLTLLRAGTPAGEEWIKDHIPDDAMTWCGAIVIEPRYVGDILAGAADDGLTIG